MLRSKPAASASRSVAGPVAGAAAAAASAAAVATAKAAAAAATAAAFVAVKFSSQILCRSATPTSSSVAPPLPCPPAEVRNSVWCAGAGRSR